MQKDPRGELHVLERGGENAGRPSQKYRNNIHENLYEIRGHSQKYENSQKDRGEMLSQDRSYISTYFKP